MRLARIVVIFIFLALTGLGIYMYVNDISYTSHVHDSGYRNSRFGTYQINDDRTVYFNATISFIFAGLTLVAWLLFERSER